MPPLNIPVCQARKQLCVVQASSADSMQKSGSGSGSRAAAQVVKLREDLPKSWEEFTRWYEVCCVPAVASPVPRKHPTVVSVTSSGTVSKGNQGLCNMRHYLLQVVIQELAPLLAPAQTGDNPEAAARVEALWCVVAHLL